MSGKFKWAVEIPPAAEWFDLDRGEKMAVETLNDTLRKIQADADACDNSACTVCGSPFGEHLGMIWNNGAHVGDAWECSDCGNRYCCLWLEKDEVK